MKRPAHTARQPGFALVTALIFLVLLTLIAVVAIRTSGLELRMGSNATLRAQVMQASEMARSAITGGPAQLPNGAPSGTATGGVLDLHIQARGWPDTAPDGTTTIGGSVDSATFFAGSTWWPYALELRKTGTTDTFGSGTPDDTWWLNNTESATSDDPCITQLSTNASDTCPTPYPSTSPPLQVDAQYVDSSTLGYQTIFANIAVYRLYATNAPGMGNAMNAGYEGLGRGAAAGGGNVYFYVLTRGQSSDSDTASAFFQTAAMYKYYVRN